MSHITHKTHVRTLPSGKKIRVAASSHRKRRKKRNNPGSKFLGIPWWGWLIGVGAGLVYLTMRSATGMISSVAQTAAAAPQLPASSDGYGTYGRY